MLLLLSAEECHLKVLEMTISCPCVVRILSYQRAPSCPVHTNSEPLVIGYHSSLERGCASDRKEWNVELIRQLFYPFDADDICKIPIPASEAEDRVAWHPERNGVFSVKSAYKLADNLAHSSQNPSSSSRESNDRSIWDLIWKAKVPGKVRIFGWRVATNTLATKESKHKRTLELDATCSICGNGREDEYHAVVRCTKSRGLRAAMREVWKLPAEKKFWYTRNGWLQVLLDSVNEDTGAKILLLFWRCWHLREDCIRSEGREKIKSSALFLEKYEEEIRLAESPDGQADGKASTGRESSTLRSTSSPAAHWSSPCCGTVKLNTDAAFAAETGVGAAGVVARDHHGEVLLYACKEMPTCNSVEEAEARAALIGLQLLAGIYNGQVILEMDNQMIFKELDAQTPHEVSLLWPNHGY